MSYSDNLTVEIKSTLKKHRQARTAPKPCKIKRLFRLYKYQCMSMGAFKLAKIFKEYKHYKYN